jgi:hypothetical protein
MEGNLQSIGLVVLLDLEPESRQCNPQLPPVNSALLTTTTAALFLTFKLIGSNSTAESGAFKSLRDKTKQIKCKSKFKI